MPACEFAEPAAAAPLAPPPPPRLSPRDSTPAPAAPPPRPPPPASRAGGSGYSAPGAACAPQPHVPRRTHSKLPASLLQRRITAVRKIVGEDLLITLVGRKYL